jgi:adenylate cyclase class 2
MSQTRPRRNAVDFMEFEVEKKFWLPDVPQTIARLTEMGIELEAGDDQIDRYYNHPARDFMQTDEVLRLRSMGPRNYVTYKGARIDSTTKTRRELELPLPDGEYLPDFEQLLGVLAFQPLMTIHKFRRKADFHWQDYDIEISLDEIDQLGSFLEVETTSDLKQLERAKKALESLAQALYLDRQEHRSYLELMLLQLGPTRPASHPPDGWSG